MEIKNIFKYTLLVCLTHSASYALANSSYTVQAPDTSQQAYSDQVGINEIKHRIERNALVSGLNIQVTSQDGKVSLTGEVNTDEEASTLIEIAESVPGTRDVLIDHLRVKKSSQPLADLAITAKVKGSFVREKLFGTAPISVMGIHVETKNGVVYLTGVADNQTQAENAMTLAKKVEGVKSVHPKITIK